MTNSIGTLWIFGESPIDLRKSFFKNYSFVILIDSLSPLIYKLIAHYAYLCNMRGSTLNKGIKRAKKMFFKIGLCLYLIFDDVIELMFCKVD